MALSCCVGGHDRPKIKKKIKKKSYIPVERNPFLNGIMLHYHVWNSLEVLLYWLIN